MQKNIKHLISAPNTKSEQTSHLYEPGAFWKGALDKILKIYLEKGIDGFRSERVNLSFFVPTYGCPGNSFEMSFVEKIKTICKKHYGQKQLREIEVRFDGSRDAFSDYRAFKIASSLFDPLELTNFSESKVGSPVEHFCFDNKWFSRSSLNYLLGLSFLFLTFPKFRPRTVLEIGGGFGTLAEILGKSNIRNLRYINFDLYPMFAIAKDYVTECFSGDQNRLVTKNTPTKEFSASDLKTFSFFPNSKIEKLRGTIDLFVNFISFQEMEPDIVKNYIKFIQQLKPKLVLIRNLREGKQILNNKRLGVKTPIIKENYIEMLSDYSLVKSNVFEFGYRTSDGFNSELLLFERKIKIGRNK